MNLYNPMTYDELRAIVNHPSDEDFDEALTGLLEKKVIAEHHDGGYTFNSVYVDFLLNHDPDGDLHREYGDEELG